jgi:Mg-chelatase subunit ChlD
VGGDFEGYDRTEDHGIDLDLSNEIVEFDGFVNFGAGLSQYHASESTEVLSRSAGKEQAQPFTRHFLGEGGTLNEFDYADVGHGAEMDNSVQDIVALTTQARNKGWAETEVPQSATAWSFPATPQTPTSFESRSIENLEVEVMREYAPTGRGENSVGPDGSTDGDATSEWGEGVRFFTVAPGAVRLDYASPLKSEPLNNNDGARFQFTMGATFGDEAAPANGKSDSTPPLTEPGPDAPARKVEKIRPAVFYDMGDATNGPVGSTDGNGSVSGKQYFFAGGEGPNGGFNVKYRYTPIASSTPGEPSTSIYSAVIREAPSKPTPAALSETSPEAEPFSTFSLHVSDVSFQLAKAALASGKWPEVEKIRIEEFVNAFDYGDPMPGMGERVACRIDQAAHPFLQQRNLVRIALRTAEAGRSSGTPLRLTLLLDSSGSMERPDRRETVRRAVATLAGLLGENDRITLVSFARTPRLVADAVAGNEAMKLAGIVAALPSEGGTNLEAALQLAFEKAREHHDAGAQNRIVLLTDGAANLGDAKAESLASLVEGMRESGIAFDAAGFGAEGLNDEILEALTRKGDGRYYLLDRPEDAEEGFAKQIAGALRPAAKNVKVQVEFNPDRVKSYKLLGFEKHRLETEDFRNDAVDAAELAAAEAGVAVYQVEPIPGGEGDLGDVSVRFRDLDSGEMVERRWTLPHFDSAPAAEQGGEAIHLATVASQFPAKLAGGPLGDVVDLGELARIAAKLPESPRVNELRTMIEQARGLEGVSVSF